MRTSQLLRAVAEWVREQGGETTGLVITAKFPVSPLEWRLAHIRASWPHNEQQRQIRKRAGGTARRANSNTYVLKQAGHSTPAKVVLEGRARRAAGSIRCSEVTLYPPHLHVT